MNIERRADDVTQDVRDRLSRDRQIIESVTEFAIIVSDRSGLVTEWNSGAELILGWKAEEMLGRSMDAFFTPADRAIRQPEREMNASLEAGRGIDERWHLKKDGSLFWASGEMMPLRNEADEHTGFVKVLRDRTEQHLAGIRLREAETQLQQAQEAGGIGLCTVDLESGLLNGTPMFSHLYGLEHIGPRVVDDFSRLVIAEDRHLASTDATRRAGTAATDVEYRIRRADTGEIRWISREGNYQFTSEGRPSRFVGIARDITAQVAAHSRQSALLALGDRLRDLTDPVAMVRTGCEVLGRAIGANLVGFGLVQDDRQTIVVEADWTNGAASLVGLVRCADYGDHIEDLRRGEVVAVSNVRQDPRVSGRADLFETQGFAAFSNLPVFEQGRCKAVLYVAFGEPHAWSAAELAFLRDGADRIRVATERARSERALHESAERQRLAVNLGEVGVFDLNLSTGELVWDACVRAAFGVVSDRPVTQDEKLRAIHPADRAMFDAAFAQSLKGKPFELQFRVVGLDDGVVRWIAVQGRTIERGASRRFIGALRDVTERVAADERRTLLNRELSHRLKNTLAIVQSIATQTLRTAPDLVTARQTLGQRIQTLAQAHEILIEGRRDAGAVDAVIRAATVLHDASNQIAMSGPALYVGPKAAMTLALIMHELSTNASKYGALSVPEGRIRIVWSVELEADTHRPILTVEWREENGPPVTAPARKGFGTRLIEMGLSGSVAGSVDLDYAPSGLECRIRASLTELQSEEN